MNKIAIKGYKSFKEAKLELHSLNILIGANGAGKSNFLSLFEMLGAIYDRRQVEYVARQGGVDKFLHQGRKVTDAIQIRIVAGDNSYEILFRSESACLHNERHPGESGPGRLLLFV